MSQSVRGGRNKYIARHGIITLIIMDSLEHIQNPVSLKNFMDLNRGDFIKAQVESLL